MGYSAVFKKFKMAYLNLTPPPPQKYFADRQYEFLNTLFRKFYPIFKMPTLSLLFLNFASLGHNFFQGPDHLGPNNQHYIKKLKFFYFGYKFAQKNINKIFVGFFTGTF